MLLFKRLVLVSAGLALVACGDGVLTDRGDIVYLKGWNADVVQPRVVQDIRPTLEEESAREYEQLMSGVKQQADSFFRSPQAVEFLGAVEQSFLLTGNYFDLVDLLRGQVEAQGMGSVTAPALAWTYLQLGNEPQVEAMIGELEAERGEDPSTWVVIGAYHASRANQSRGSARQARDAFEKVLELDPNFGGFMALEAGALRQQLDMLRRQVPAEVADRAVDGVMIEEEAPSRESDRASAVERGGEVFSQAQAVALAHGEARAIGASAAEEQIPPADEQEQRGAADGRARAALEVARGQRALQSGGDRLQEAQNHFRRALHYDEDNLDAGIGLLRVAGRTGAPEEMLTEQVDRLADRALTARQAYDLGLFCLRNLKDTERATSLLERVEALDPQLARRLGIGSLLQR